MNGLWMIVPVQRWCYTSEGCTAGRTAAETALSVHRQKAPSNSVPQGEQTGMEAEEKQDAVS